MVQTVGTLGRFTECAGSGDGLSRSRGEISGIGRSTFFWRFPAFQGTPDRPFGLSRPCMPHGSHTATTVTPEPLRKLISKTGEEGKDPFCASANFLDTSHICGVQENVRGRPSRRRASLLLAALNVTRLRHLQHAQHAPRAPAAVQLSIASCFTSRLLHPPLISPNLISASQRHVDKCSQRDAHHAFPDFVFQTSLLTIDSSTAEVSATNRIIGNPSDSSTPPPSSRGAASKLGL